MYCANTTATYLHFLQAKLRKAFAAIFSYLLKAIAIGFEYQYTPLFTHVRFRHVHCYAKTSFRNKIEKYSQKKME